MLDLFLLRGLICILFVFYFVLLEVRSYAEVPQGEGAVRANLPPNCAFPPGYGGGLCDPFRVDTYVDDTLFA